MKAAVKLSITQKHFLSSVSLLLPQLSEKDSHHFGHVDVDVDGEFDIRVIEIVNIIDLGFKVICHSEPKKYVDQQEQLTSLQTQITQRRLTIIPPQRGE